MKNLHTFFSTNNFLLFHLFFMVMINFISKLSNDNMKNNLINISKPNKHKILL